ncbi:nonribosomal peptide synthetase, partial [Blastosporella zonata]
MLRSVIEEANKVAPTFSRIFKEMILITSRDKPLPRTGKGTVMRKMALKAYNEEIEGL